MMQGEFFKFDSKILLVYRNKQIQSVSNSENSKDSPGSKNESVQIKAKYNKEKLKIALQITGVLVSHSFSLTEEIYNVFNSKYPNEKSENQKEPIDQNLKEIRVEESDFQKILSEKLIEKGYLQNTEKKISSYFSELKLASDVLEGKHPLIILLGGTSGTGKSTQASILAAQFGISSVLSSDSIRHILRNFIQKEENPILFASTYQAGQYVTLQEEDMNLNNAEQKKIIKGYKTQAKEVQAKLQEIIDVFATKQESIVIEGVHLTPYFMFRMFKKHQQVVIPFTISIGKESEHKSRFAIRSQYMTLDKSFNKYLKSYNNIRLIQQWFLQQTDQYLIPKINNINIDKSLNIIHRVIINFVKRCKTNKIDFQELQNCLPLYEQLNNLNAKNMQLKQKIDLLTGQADKNMMFEKFLDEIGKTTFQQKPELIECVNRKTYSDYDEDQKRQEPPETKAIQKVSSYNNLINLGEKSNEGGDHLRELTLQRKESTDQKEQQENIFQKMKIEELIKMLKQGKQIVLDSQKQIENIKIKIRLALRNQQNYKLMEQTIPEGTLFYIQQQGKLKGNTPLSIQAPSQQISDSGDGSNKGQCGEKENFSQAFIGSQSHLMQQSKISRAYGSVLDSENESLRNQVQQEDEEDCLIGNDQIINENENESDSDHASLQSIGEVGEIDDNQSEQEKSGDQDEQKIDQPELSPRIISNVI